MTHGSRRRKQSQARAIISRQVSAFLFAKLVSNGPHDEVDVISPRAVSKRVELSKNIFRVLRSQRSSPRPVTHGSMARLTWRNAPLAVAGRDQPRRNLSPCIFRLRLRKTAIVLRIRVVGKHRVISRQIQKIARRQRSRNRLHHRRPPFVTPKILQLLPGRKFVNGRKIRRISIGTEAFRSMAVIASSRQQHPVQRVSVGSLGNRFIGPRNIGGNVFATMTAHLQPQRMSDQAERHDKNKNRSHGRTRNLIPALNRAPKTTPQMSCTPNDRISARHSPSVRPAAGQGTAPEVQPPTATAS
jgi:hypothetical protein